MVVGALSVLALQSLLIYGMGIHIVVSRTQAYGITRTLALHLREEWPSLRGPVLKAARPVVAQEVTRMVGAVTVDVGGVRVRLPVSLQKQLAKDINRLLLSDLHHYWSTRFNPNRLLTPQVVNQILARPLVLHAWVRAGIVPIPVTLSSGGS